MAYPYPQEQDIGTTPTLTRYGPCTGQPSLACGHAPARLAAPARSPAHGKHGRASPRANVSKCSLFSWNTYARHRSMWGQKYTIPDAPKHDDYRM